MTKRVSLYQNERLDIEDAKDLQDLVYEYVQRALYGVLGSGGGLCGDGITVSFGLWDNSTTTYKVTLSGKEYITRSSKYQIDYSEVGAGTATPEGMLKSGVGKGFAQVMLFDSASTQLGQSSNIDFASVVSAAGGAEGWASNATKYSVYARRFEKNAESEGRIYWNADGSGEETQISTNTRRAEIVVFHVALSSDATALQADGYVRVFNITAVDADATSDTYTRPTLTPHLAIDQAAEGEKAVGGTNTDATIRTALENADTNTLLSTPPGSVGGLVEAFGYVVRQLGWLFDPTLNFPDTTFKKPASGVKQLSNFLSQFGASQRMPYVMFSGVIQADLQNGAWKFGSLGNSFFNSAFEDKTSATDDSQGVFLNLYSHPQVLWLSLDSDSANWNEKGSTAGTGPSYRPLASAHTVAASAGGGYAYEENIHPQIKGENSFLGTGLVQPVRGAYFDLKLDYDARKVKITSVHATPYANVANYDADNGNGSQITAGDVMLATAPIALAPVVLVYKNSIYIRTAPGSENLSEAWAGEYNMGSGASTPDGYGHGRRAVPQSITLTIFGYHDDGQGDDGYGSESAFDNLGTGPLETGGSGVKNT